MSRKYPEDEPRYNSPVALFVGVCVVLGILLALAIIDGAVNGGVRAACGEHYAPNPPHEPTGVKGCVVYGDGTASRYPGAGVARNDCVWPWTGCTTIAITAIETGNTIIVTPSMFCDCYTGTNNERIVDLDAASVAALGLDWDDGLYAVTVEPASIGPMALPDTALAP